MPRSVTLQSDADVAEFSLTVAFLEKRLNRRETIEWALTSNISLPAQEAIRRLVQQRSFETQPELWRRVWSLVLEFWQRGAKSHGIDGLARHLVEQRLRAGELSGALVTDLAELVAPRLLLEPQSQSIQTQALPKNPRNVSDVMRATITSEREIDLRRFSLVAIEDRAFLIQLARALEVDIDYGLDLAARLGWDVERDSWRLGFIRRVYFVLDVDPDEEPDRFDEGLTPAVKLLHAAVSRLAMIEPTIAAGFARAWYLRGGKLYRRLWAALSFNSDVTPASEVEEAILSLSTAQFWDLHALPEFTELRARRFTQLTPSAQATILSKIRSGPPAKRWGRVDDRARVRKAQHYWRARELRRLEIGGAVLPEQDRRHLDKALVEFPELRDISIDYDFLDGVRTYRREPDPDKSLDTLTGDERLSALERAFAKPSSFSDDPAQRAADWLSSGNNVSAVLTDLAQAPQAGSGYPLVWERFGWTHGPASRDLTPDEVHDEIVSVLSLLSNLPLQTAGQAIEGISFWLSVWEQNVDVKAGIGPIWLRLWPLAVEATNKRESQDEVLNFLEQDDDEGGARDIDTLNTAVGRFVGVFLARCPNLRRTKKPFQSDVHLQSMRRAIAEASHRAGLIGKYRLIQSLSYFLRADREWTLAVLIPALKANTDSSRTLWRALVGGYLSQDMLRFLNKEIVNNITDERLARDTRNRLLFMLVVRTLENLRGQKKRPIPAYAVIQQLLRTVEPELRSHAAQAISRVQKEWTNKSTPAEEIFKQAVMPFVKEVWPQERSLASPGTSKYLADIPASAKGEFVRAVQTVKRFIVPFDCWSLSDFGLSSFDDEDDTLEIIDSVAKSEALIDLLNLSVGTNEDSVVPYDLSKALAHIRRVAPQVSETPAFRRLAAAARLS